MKVGGWRWAGESGESTRYLALAFSPFPGTLPPLSGFLQSLQVGRLIHLGPGLLNVGCGVSHGCTLYATNTSEKTSDKIKKNTKTSPVKPPPSKSTSLPGDFSPKVRITAGR